MSEPARRLATAEDLARTPDDGRVYEILDGELGTRPRPVPAHGWAQAVLCGEIVPPFDRGRGGPGGWWIVIEPEVMLEVHQIVVPDLVGWRRERLPQLPAERPIATKPDWICEVVSPSDRGRDRVRKADLYLRSGIPHYWIVDPRIARSKRSRPRPDGGCDSAPGLTATRVAWRPSMRSHWRSPACSYPCNPDAR